MSGQNQKKQVINKQMEDKKSWKKALVIILPILLIGLGLFFYINHTKNVSDAMDAVPVDIPELPDEGMDTVEAAEATFPEGVSREKPLDVEVVSNDADISASLVEAAQLDVQSAETALIAAKNSEDEVAIVEKQAKLDKAKEALAKMK